MSSDPKTEDLDAFLTGVESKLRGPFSSLDLAKAVTTTALRGSLTPKEYLQLIGKVLARTDKVIQLRILVGLLGLDPSEETSQEIYSVLQQAQQAAPLHEEWVRTVSGLIQGIMFQEDGQSSTRESCRGEEAKTLLETTCGEILERLQQQVDNNNDEEEASSSSASPDMNPFFAPYYFSLLNSNLLEQTIPINSNPHFQVNESASILKIDEQLEETRAKEENQHTSTTTNGADQGQRMAGGGKNNRTTTQNPNAREMPPGFRPIKLVSDTKTPASKSSSSLFIPSKKPGAGGAGIRGGGVGGQTKTNLHTRKAGAAQSLLMKNKLKSRMAGKFSTTTGGTSSSSAAAAGQQQQGGRAMAHRSKMKMIDINEVDTLTKEHQKREETISLADKLKSRKHKILQQSGLVQKQRKVDTTATNNGGGSDVAVAPVPVGSKKNVAAPALSKTKPQTAATAASVQPQVGAAAAAATHPATTTNTPKEPPIQAVDSNSLAAAAADQGSGREHDWRLLLQERSNKLAADDRFRVQQFFEQHYNPTPTQSVYKMKLHEERGNDPTSGQATKETFYLELDYNTFTSKQSKKVKRY
jgi:hypothetical protein